VKAEILFDALAILRAVKDLDLREFPAGLEWIRVQRAHSQLELALILAGLTVQVEEAQ
jgi:hypothetical protein